MRTILPVRCDGCGVAMSAPEGNTDPCPHCGGRLVPLGPRALKGDRVSDTLFDEYPSKPTKPRPDRHCKCEINHLRPLNVWQAIHEVAHSRVPFTEAWLCDRMGYEASIVAAVCKQAEAQEWIGHPPKESPNDTTVLWVGRLRKKR